MTNIEMGRRMERVKNMAEIKVLCDICQRKAAVQSCKLCGRRVCADHYDAKSGMCTEEKRK